MARGTISQRIIARAAGREEVGVGEIVTVRVDLAMANDITAPLAIKQMEAAGAQRVFDPERICIVAGRHAPFRDIAFAEMVHHSASGAVVRESDRSTTTVKGWTMRSFPNLVWPGPA